LAVLATIKFGRTRQTDFGHGHVLISLFALVFNLAAELKLRAQAFYHFLQQPAFSLVLDSANLITAQNEQMPLTLPAPQMQNRIAFAIDYMHQFLGQTQALDVIDRPAKLIESGPCRQDLFSSRAVNAIGGALTQVNRSAPSRSLTTSAVCNS
jgi:hypothetical protein